MALCMSACYKNPKFSDVTVQIWQQFDVPGSPSTPPCDINGATHFAQHLLSSTDSSTSTNSNHGSNTAAAGADTTSTYMHSQPYSHNVMHTAHVHSHDGASSQALALSHCLTAPGRVSHQRENLIDEFPGHKVVFYAVSEYYKAMFEWDELDTIRFTVQEHQILAAQALVYYTYHHLLPAGLSPADAGQLLVLADEYQMEGCVSLCVALLEEAVDGGNNLEATLEVCRVLGHIGMVSPAVESFFSLFQKHAWQFRGMFARLVVPAGGISIGRKGGYSNYRHAVDVLRSMFQDMERTWAQEEFRQIMHLFPMEIVKAVLEWDLLSPASENTVVAAIHDWMLAQPDVPDHQALKEEEALLSVVRVPYLSASYLSQVFPSLYWVQTHNETASNMMMYGTHAAFSLNKLPPEAIASTMPPELRYMVLPRQYKVCPTEIHLEWDTPWQVVHEAKQVVDKTHTCSELHGPKAWVNGVRVGLYIRVNPPMRVGEVGNAAITGYWAWQAPSPKSRKGGETCVMATYDIKFEHVVVACNRGSKEGSEGEANGHEGEGMLLRRRECSPQEMDGEATGEIIRQDGERGVGDRQVVRENLGQVEGVVMPESSTVCSRRTSMEVDVHANVMDDEESQHTSFMGEKVGACEREKGGEARADRALKVGVGAARRLGQQSGRLVSSRFFTRTGICELFRTYPENAEKMARDGHMLRCSLTISEIL